MKRIGLIVFALLAVAIAVPVVLVATLPTAKVTIVAIRPTGQFATYTNADGEVVDGEEWLFGITNIGRVGVDWDANIESRQSKVQSMEYSEHFFSATISAGTSKVLKPGEGLITNMMVAVADKTEWRCSVSCGPQLTSLQTHLLHLGLQTPGLKGRLEDYLIGSSTETPWHPGTNAPMASSTVTNTP